MLGRRSKSAQRPSGGFLRLPSGPGCAAKRVRHTHVKDEDLIDAPSWPDVLEPLREFMGEDILAFHSAKSADISMMEKACEQ